MPLPFSIPTIARFLRDIRNQAPTRAEREYMAARAAIRAAEVKSRPTVALAQPEPEKIMPDFTDAPVPVKGEFPLPPASEIKYWRGRVGNLEREIQHIEKTMLKLSDALAAEKKRSRLANSRADKEAKDAARFSLWLKPFWVFAEKNGCPPGVKQTDFVLAMAQQGVAMNGGCTAKEAGELRAELDEALSSVDVLAKELNAAMADAANSPKPADTLERRVRRLEAWGWGLNDLGGCSAEAERRLCEHEAKQNGSA